MLSVWYFDKFEILRDHENQISKTLTMDEENDQNEKTFLWIRCRNVFKR